MSLWDVLVSIFWFMLLVAWFWLLVTVVTDVFRDSTLSGAAKAGWCLFVLILPWIGVATYLIVRGRSMGERSAHEAAQREQAFQTYVRETAGASTTSVADELGKLAALHDQGTISAQEYEHAKSQVIHGTAPADISGLHTDRPHRAGSTP